MFDGFLKRRIPGKNGKGTQLGGWNQRRKLAQPCLFNFEPHVPRELSQKTRVGLRSPSLRQSRQCKSRNPATKQYPHCFLSSDQHIQLVRLLPPISPPPPHLFCCAGKQQEDEVRKTTPASRLGKPNAAQQCPKYSEDHQPRQDTRRTISHVRRSGFPSLPWSPGLPHETLQSLVGSSLETLQRWRATRHANVCVV